MKTTSPLGREHEPTEYWQSRGHSLATAAIRWAGLLIQQRRYSINGGLARRLHFIDNNFLLPYLFRSCRDRWGLPGALTASFLRPSRLSDNLRTSDSKGLIGPSITQICLLAYSCTSLSSFLSELHQACLFWWLCNMPIPLEFRSVHHNEKVFKRAISPTSWQKALRD